MKPTAALALTLLFLPAGISAQEETAPDVARAAIAEFRKEYRTRDERARIAAVDRLTGYRHKSVADELKTVAERDSDPAARLLAIRGLQKQDSKIAPRYIWSVFNAQANQSDPRVKQAALEAFTVLEFCPPFRDFIKGADRSSKEEQRALCQVVRYHRQMEAAEFLAARLDMPQPANVDCPNNPPASYWKEKVEVWTHCINAVHEGLVHLTGRDFESEKDFKDWRKNGGKILSLEDGRKAMQKY